MAQGERRFLPAAGHEWLLPFYDPLVRLAGGDAARRLLVEQAELSPGHRVLEVGCGTGSLLLLAARVQPGVVLTGLDPDAKALARARRKAARAGVPIALDRGFSDALPYPDASFDRALSCLMFHHLGSGEERRGTLVEIKRVLRPAGRLHLLDFTSGRPPGRGVLSRWLHPSHQVDGEAGSHVLALMAESGLRSPRIVSRGALLTMPIACYEATAPAP